jgi:prolyl-tRNA synthetase
MKCVFLDENNKEKPMIMGCYGIGVGRTAQAAVEQSFDKDGIVWPAPLAPFKVAVIPMNSSDKDQLSVAEGIYKELNASGIEVLLDDRDQRAGVKLKDIDLIGIPTKVIVGKALKEGKVEVKSRKTGETQLVKKEEVAGWLKQNVLC